MCLDINGYMMSKEEPLIIRANLKGKDVEAFLKVKEYLGLFHNTEVIRALIKEKINKIEEAQVA